MKWLVATRASFVQILDLIHELAHFLELAIDGGEAHVGHGIKLLEFLHGHVANLVVSHLEAVVDRQGIFDVRRQVFQIFPGHRALLARIHEALHQLFALKRLLFPTTLDNRQRLEFNIFTGREPATARQTFAAPAN